ncbi:MAG: DUF2384 domain-containing protein [Desulfobacterales bacterium]|nr:DUF2384 domain-containing protein [Desulfobacterales bacterium]
MTAKTTDAKKPREKSTRKGVALSELASDEQMSPKTLIDIIRKGVDYSLVERLRSDLSLSTGEIGELIDITPRTLSRRKKEGRLAKDESERTVRIGRLWEKAVDVFDGDEDRARKWFKSPAFSLGDKTPLEFADTEPGAQEVFNLLGRIEHGLGA